MDTGFTCFPALHHLLSFESSKPWSSYFLHFKSARHIFFFKAGAKMRHQQLAVKCSHLSLIWLLAQKDFLFVATGLLSGQSPGCQRYRGFKMSQQRTGRCFFIYRTTTFGYIHLIFLAAANHAATQPTWSVPTSTGTNRCERSTLGLCSVYRLLDLNIKSKKKQKKKTSGHRRWWQRNLWHRPPPPIPEQRSGCPVSV